jgi:HEAT repeat protein
MRIRRFFQRRAFMISALMLLVTVPALVGVLLSRGEPSPGASKFPRDAKDGAALAPDHPAYGATLGLTTGETWAYHLRQATTISDEAALSEGAVTRLEAFLHVRVLEVAPTHATLGMQLSRISLSSGAGSPVSNVASMLANTPAFVEMDPLGRMLSVRFSAAVPPADQDQVRGLVAGLQIVLDPSPLSIEWQTQESDVNGGWACNYDRAPTGIIRKRRANVSNPSSGLFALETVSSEIEATLGDPWLDRLRAREEMFVKQQGNVLYKMVSELFVERVAETSGPPSALSEIHIPLRAGTQGVSAHLIAPHTPGAAEKDELAKLRTAFTGVALSASVQKLAAAVKSAKSHAATVGPMNHLADHLRAIPSAAGELAAMLKNPAMGDALASRAIHALELSGATTPESQAALATIIANPAQYPSGVVSQATVAAGGVEQILDPGLAVALQGLATGDADEFLRDAAVLALGNLGNGNPALASEMTAALGSNLDPSSHADDIRVSLWSLANGRLSDEHTLSKTVQLLQHNDPSVRAAAVEYLGLVTSGQEAGLLPLLDDPDETVKIAAVRGVLSPDDPSAQSVAAVLEIAASNDAAESLRGAALAQVRQLPRF